MFVSRVYALRTGGNGSSSSSARAGSCFPPGPGPYGQATLQYSDQSRDRNLLDWLTKPGYQITVRSVTEEHRLVDDSCPRAAHVRADKH